MTRVLIRMVRSRAVWEHTPAEIQQLEFRDRDTGEPDLRPSVYLVDIPGPELCQACAEHTASVPLDVKDLITLESATRWPVVCVPDSTKFEFIKTRHREVHVDDEQALQQFIVALKERHTVGDVHTVTKADQKGYARERVTAGDPEWIAVVNEPGTKEWLRKLATAPR